MRLTGTHLWADRFDGSLEDVFELQDKVASASPASSSRHCRPPRSRRSAARPTTDLTAYDLYLRALATFFPITKERIFEALGLLEQAIAIDPHYGPALAWAAICHLRLVSDGWAEAPETTRRKGIDLARQALEVAENDPGVLANAAFVLAHIRRGYRRHDWAGRPCARAQPELRPRLVYERPSQDLCRPTRSRDRACRDLAAPEPARAYGYAAIRDRRGLFLQTSV